MATMRRIISRFETVARNKWRFRAMGDLFANPIISIVGVKW